VPQLSHHNTNARRDALTGLQQLLTAHPAEARRHAALLLDTLAPRLADGEASVRAALLALLRTALLPALGPAGLGPFLPLLSAHLSASLTHLSADVRYDSLAVLEALTEAAPGLMAQQAMLGRMLGHYASLLSRANRGKSVKSQALAGLSRVASSLHRYLGNAVARAGAVAGAAAGGSDGPAAAWGSGAAVQPDPCAPLMAHRAAVAAPLGAGSAPTAAKLLRLYCSSTDAASSSRSSATGRGQTPGSSGTRRQQQQAQQGAPFAAAKGADEGDAQATDSQGGTQQLQAQVLRLLGVLFDCWAEAAPASLSAAPELESAAVLVHILASAQLLTALLLDASGQPAAAGGAGAAGGPAAAGAAVPEPSLCPGFNTLHEQQAVLAAAAAIMLPRLLRAFPVSPPGTANISGALYDLLQRFNLLAMRLLTDMLAAGVVWPLAPSPPPQQHHHHHQQQQQTLPGQEWQQRLVAFMAGEWGRGPATCKAPC
jgi:pre-rRNA-processing protein IPI1